MSHAGPRTKFIPASRINGQAGSIEDIARELASDTGLRVVVVDDSGHPLVEIGPPHADANAPTDDDLWGAMRGTVEILDESALTAGSGASWKADA
ncbi:MAG TPA: hypothetical protein VD995_25110 [Azospirillum sp.]|nr:hypothetical protein [Azospirillum sp.]